jgi:hypothetical protein
MHMTVEKFSCWKLSRYIASVVIWKPLMAARAFGPKRVWSEGLQTKTCWSKRIVELLLSSQCSKLAKKNSNTKCNFIVLKSRTQNAILWLMALKFQTQNEIWLIWNFWHKMKFYGFEVWVTKRNLCLWSVRHKMQFYGSEVL